MYTCMIVEYFNKLFSYTNCGVFLIFCPNFKYGVLRPYSQCWYNCADVKVNGFHLFWWYRMTSEEIDGGAQVPFLPNSANVETDAWKKIEAKTGEIAPNNILELLLLSKEELDVLILHPKLSKNQKKKVMRRNKWLEAAPERIEKRKEKKRQGKLKHKRPKQRKITTTENFESKFHIGIDFATGAEMVDKEKMDLAKQARWCYQKYRRSENEVQLHFLGFDDEQNEGMKKLFDMHSGGWEGWDVHRDKLVTDYKTKGGLL